MIRERLIFSVSLIAMVLAGLAAGFTASELKFQTRGYEDPTRSFDLPYRVPIVGLNGNWMGITSGQLQAELSTISDAKVTWIRQFIPWNTIELEPDTFVWTSLDNLMATLHRHPDIELVAWLDSRPHWIADDDYASALAKFASSFAERYGEIIDHYQIGELNENVEIYTETLAAVYPAIREVDPQAQIITAPLPSPQELNFLEKLYSLGANHFWDIVAISHDSSETTAADRRIDPKLNNLSRLILVREMIQERNEGTKPIWLVDFGGKNSVTDEDRTDYALVIQRAQREWPWLGVIFLPDSVREESAIFDEISNLQNSAPQNGLFSMQHEAIHYSGEWSFDDDAADYSRAIESELRFPFYGREIALLLREDAWHTVLFADVDGKAPNALPKIEDDRGYLILTSADRMPNMGLTTVAHHLPLSEHELHLIGGGGDTHFTLRGIAISSGNLARPFENQISLALISYAVAAAFACYGAYPLLQPHIKRFQSFRFSMQSKKVERALRQPAFDHKNVYRFLLTFISYIILHAQFHSVISLFVSAALLVLFVRNREIGLFLVLFTLPFARIPITFWQFHFPPAELMLLMTLAAEILVRFYHWRQSLFSVLTAKWQTFDILSLLWVTLGATTLIWARWPEPAITDWRTLFLEPAIFYLLLRLNAREMNRQQFMVLGLLLGGMLISALGIYQLLSDSEFAVAEAGVRRLVSVYGSPNHVALFLGRCIPYTIVFWLCSPSARLRYLAAGGSILMLSATLLTQSYASLILGIPAVFLTVLLATRLRLFRFLSIAVLILLILTIVLGGRLSDWWNWQEGSLFVRVNVWKSALEMLSDQPLSGFGLDQFLYAYRDIYIGPDAWQDPDISHPHNFILDVWLRLGILGVVFFFLFQWNFWRTIYPSIRSDPLKNNWHSLFVLATAGSMIYMLAHGLVDNSLFVLDLAYLFSFQIALTQLLPINTATPS